MNREFYEDSVTAHLKQLLEDQLFLVRDRWKAWEAKDGHGVEVNIYTDLQDQLPKTPAVEIVYKDSDNEQIAVGTGHEKFNYSILVTVNNNHPEEGKIYCNIIARSVVEILNLYDNRAFPLDNANFNCIYDSYASRLESGYRRGKGLRTVNIAWWGKMMKPDKIAN